MVTNLFEVQVRSGQGMPVIELKGDINSSAEESLNLAFNHASESKPAAMLLSFKDVTYMNSTGIALIVGLLAQARKRKIELRAAGLSEHYRHIFTITRLSDFMNIYEDEASATADAGASGPQG